MALLLIKVFFCFFASSPDPKTNIVYQKNAASETTEQDKKEEEERADNSLEKALFGSGAGLVAVGGIGAGVVAYNNKKPKNVPTNKSENLSEEKNNKE